MLSYVQNQTGVWLRLNDASELISTPYGLEQYPSVSLHNGMKSILKDFYLFHEVKKMEKSFFMISKCVLIM